MLVPQHCRLRLGGRAAGVEHQCRIAVGPGYRCFAGRRLQPLPRCQHTGTGLAASVGYRFGFVAPYVAYDYFQSTSCDAGSLTSGQLVTCNATVDTAGSRNLKAGVNFFFNKNQNHLNVEFGVNHGLSAYGPSSVTAAAAGYLPSSLDPLTATGPRRQFSNALANPAFKSLLVHWNVLF